MVFLTKLYICVICVCLLVQFLHAAILHTPQEVGPGPCIDKNGIKRKLKEIWTDNERCEKHRCVVIRGIRNIKTYKCTVIDNPEGCTIIKRKGPYPRCCPDIQC
ncbi:toxin-like protein 14 [Centruroides sculpturatus]|uniref:toxin-like protein 14 n=1 Tax=Centruroides sculpturatus TaxID=218467 RepID=UPI000C6E3E16|nr:toxin-like protein 14 [Centruroides sculpturatus]